MHTFFLVGIVLLLAVTASHGKIYKWTDHNGKVHFTDNLSGVPPEYRGQVEERTSTPPSRQQPIRVRRSLPPPSPLQDTPTSQRYTIPLRREGNAMIVTAVLNGSVHLPLMVDTGAEITNISTSAAQQLGLNLDDAAVIPLRSASDVYLAPLTKIKSITVGEVTVQDVEVTVWDIVPGGNIGLLGMSFLDNFQVIMNAAEQTMSLTTLTGAPGQPLHGGHSEDWWRRKFHYYRRNIEKVKAYLSNRQSELADLGIKSPSQSKFAKTLRYFQAELTALERKASQAAVPRQWRY